MVSLNGAVNIYWDGVHGIDNFIPPWRKFDPSAMKNGWDNAGKTWDVFLRMGI